MSAKWIQLAVGSGLAAATNGLFAKLTTTSLTSDFSGALAGLLSLEKDNKFVEFVVRGVCFTCLVVLEGWWVLMLCGRPFFY